MPSGPERLWNKFTRANAEGQTIDDGIETCREIIKSAGGRIDRGMITLPKAFDTKTIPDLTDAIDYLCLEWDYDFQRAK